MDPRLLRLYNREIQHLREMGGEFATEFPKIAGRLGLDSFECADPYVERLLEGFAFLAARVQLKIEAEFPRFTQHLLEMVYPHYLSPTPSMAVVQFEPDLTEGALGEGFPIPRDTALRSVLGKGDQTPCEYRTAHDVTLWPLEIVEAEYVTSALELSTLEGAGVSTADAAIRIRLRTTAGLTLDQISLDRLTLYLRGSGEIAMKLYEQLLANAVAVVVRPPDRPPPWQERIDRSEIRRTGFDDSQALLPCGPRSFQGYRLLHEYFAFPERFLFVEISGFSPSFQRSPGRELDLWVALDRIDTVLEQTLDASFFALNCSPALNLFPRRTDRIHLSESQTEYHVLPDRTRPMDFEVHHVTGVTGHGATADRDQEFLPFYAVSDLTMSPEGLAFYALRRVPRVLSSKQRRLGPRTSYVGSEVFVSLVDAAEAPYRSDLRQLSLETYCTNRDLPISMTVGQGRTDFTLQIAAPVESVRCVDGPTKPHASSAEGENAWRLVSHLSLNYLSILDSDERKGAAALRELMMLYGGDAEASLKKQVEGVRSVTSKPIHRWIETEGPSAFGRGLEISVTMEEAAFTGSGVFLLGAVLEQFFAKYVSINSFTETVVLTTDRGEVIRWPTRPGRRHVL
jgi:type VI secretion system protein ImpG